MLRNKNPISNEDVQKFWAEPFEWDDEKIMWLRSRSYNVRRLMHKFPPDCKVKMKCNSKQLKKGEVGIVVSHFDDESLLVIVPRGKLVRVHCQPEWLELIKCRNGLTVEKMKELLK